MGINWSEMIITALTSAIVAIFFTGGTNFILQKTNRKGNLISEKGPLIIEQILDINEERTNLLKYCTFFTGFEKEEILIEYKNYSIKCHKFNKTIQTYDFILDKKIKIKLYDYYNYIIEVKDALWNVVDGDIDSYSINVNNKKPDILVEEIIRQIKKQII
jgi:hypothetical protein